MLEWFWYQTSWWVKVLIIGVLILVILPPRFDPAIKWKEWRERKRDK